MFDSGIGGLSVLREARVLMPEHRFVYVADDASFPIGGWEEGALIKRLMAVFEDLVERYDPSMIIVACNTASTTALDVIRKSVPCPVVGVVPAVKPAAHSSTSKVIGVLGTPGTVKRDYVDDLIANFARDCDVILHGSTELL